MPNVQPQAAWVTGIVCRRRQRAAPGGAGVGLDGEVEGRAAHPGGALVMAAQVTGLEAVQGQAS